MQRPLLNAMLTIMTKVTSFLYFMHPDKLGGGGRGGGGWGAMNQV